MTDAPAPAGPARAMLWDLAVRLIHWSFVALLPALWWTAEHDAIALHKQLGLILLAVLAARLLWGVVGSESARFARFVKGPRAILAYLRGKVKPAAGHNPLGALSVVALLGLLVAEVALGLITQDVDGIESGPLNHLVSFDVAEQARHLLAPMVSGRKLLRDGVAAPVMAPAWRALVCAGVAAALAWWLGAGAPL